MSKSNAQNPNKMRVALGALTVTTLVKAMRLNKKIRIVGFKVVDKTGVAEDGTNFLEIQLKRDAILLAQISQETGNQGALVAGVWSLDAPEVIAAKNLGIEADRGADLDVNVVKNGTAVLTAGAVAEISYYNV